MHVPEDVLFAVGSIAGFIPHKRTVPALNSGDRHFCVEEELVVLNFDVS